MTNKKKQTEEGQALSMLCKNIGHALAADRIKAFKCKKKPYLYDDHPTEIAYPKEEFLEMLSTVIENDNMTGLRIYFGAVGPDLTLVFAPTTDLQSCDLTNTGDLLITQHGSPAHIVTNITEGTRRIINFRKSNGLRQDLAQGLRQGLGEGETTSLWFCKANLRATRDDINSEHTNTTYITACFAAYKDPDDEVVDFGRYHMPKPIESVRRHSQLALIFRTDDPSEPLIEFYDTGAPCPPDPGCLGSPFDPPPNP